MGRARRLLQSSSTLQSYGISTELQSYCTVLFSTSSELQFLYRATVLTQSYSTDLQYFHRATELTHCSKATNLLYSISTEIHVELVYVLLQSSSTSTEVWYFYKAAEVLYCIWYYFFRVTVLLHSNRPPVLPQNS
jgi:hypothetical protein